MVNHNKLPRNIIAAALFDALWKNGADGEELMRGWLGTLRDIAMKEGGQSEVDRLAEAFRSDSVVIEHGF